MRVKMIQRIEMTVGISGLLNYQTDQNPCNYLKYAVSQENYGKTSFYYAIRRMS